MIKYLESFGVQFHYGVKVENVEFDIKPGRKQAKNIVVTRDGKTENIGLTENDLVFITNGGCVENSTLGSQNEPAPFNKEICMEWLYHIGVPKDAVNFAFLGQFAETKRDTIFTTEHSMRTGMEAVYTLLNVDRGVPEVWGSTYDVRDLLNATIQLRDGHPLTEMKLGLKEKMAVKKVLETIRGTDVEKILKEYHVIE